MAFLWEREKGGGEGENTIFPHPSSRWCNSIKWDNTVLEKLVFYLLFLFLVVVSGSRKLTSYGWRCNSIEEQMLKERVHVLKFVEDTYL